MADTMRLDKLLTQMGLGSRSQVKEMIRKGRVAVDGLPCQEPERKVVLGRETVTADGQAVAWTKAEYYMLNKPAGVISATEDPVHRTVVDLIDTARRKSLFPVGRLDIDTEGLLLITSDGDLAHRLLSPKKHVDKVYFARVRGTLDPDIGERFEAGITLEDGTRTLPAVLSLERQWEEGGISFSEARLTIREGKYHQVKRMFGVAGGEVVYLKRLSMGPLTLDPHLLPGEYRALTPEELTNLRERTGCEVC